MKKILPSIVVICFIALILGYSSTKKGTPLTTPNPEIPLVTKTSYKDASYLIDNHLIKLNNGFSEIEAVPGSASKITTTYFGNELYTDLNNDSKEDVVFLLTQTSAGSGTFYYVVAAIATENGYAGSRAVLLGDRIAPQTINKGKGTIIIVNYADRSPGESFTVQPSLGKSLWLLLDPKTMQFGQVEQNFEGEADGNIMSLGMKKWTWIQAEDIKGKLLTPKQSKAFVLTFSTSSNTFSATTDCNTLTGKYVTERKKLTFETISATKKFCKNSQESVFGTILANTKSYIFTGKGELILNSDDNSTAIFK